MVDPQDDHSSSVVIYLVDHAVRATTRRPQPGQLPLQRVTDPARAAHECAGDELDYGDGGALWQSGQ
jgi:hypothetical protein